MSAPLNYQTLFEIDTNPAGVATYVRLGDGLSTATAANNENVDTKAYLDDDGGQSSEVTSFQYVQTFSGDWIPDDAAQYFIFERLFSLGENRHTNFRQTGPDGTVITGDITIANITPPGGDSGSTSAVGFDMRFNGKPTRTAPSAADALTATVAGGSASGTTSFTATPDSGNSLGYRLTAAALSPNGRAYADPGLVIAYTSGDDIPATVGQYLNMYEVDAYNHIVKFLSDELESGDITA